MVFIPPLSTFSRGADQSSSPHNIPTQDPYTFLRPEDFFQGVLDKPKSGFQTPRTCEIKLAPDRQDHRLVGDTGAMFTLDPDKPGPHRYLLIQFVRPTLFRLRFDPSITDPERYSDDNTPTIVYESLPQLIETLDQFECIHWNAVLTRVADIPLPTGAPEGQQAMEAQFTHYRLTTYTYPTEEERQMGLLDNATAVMSVLIQKDPFTITAVRTVTVNTPVLSTLADKYKYWVPRGTELHHTKLEGQVVSTQQEGAVIWESMQQPLSYKQIGDTWTTVLSVRKPNSAKYMGFGEQAGQSFLKTSTYMNFFDYDNNSYNAVYKVGPLDEREPLYHSEPFWVELNARQYTRSKVASFTDNLSQVLVDFAQTQSNRVRIATRFGILDHYVMAGDDVADVIKLYTSIIGRPHLKPRYVLGYHQAAYGGLMDKRESVIIEAQRYRANQFPLDTLQIDIDFQDNYKTFTIDRNGLFPDPENMFKYLRSLGVKCGTNITPIISHVNAGQYKTFQEGYNNGYFVRDKRKIDKYINTDWQVVTSDYVWNVAYEGGRNTRDNPRSQNDPETIPIYDPNPDFDYYGRFTNSFNQPNPKYYFGGVKYGPPGIGTDGYYPNLLRAKVREWWGEQYQDLFTAGLEFVWQDMTAPAIARMYGDMKSFPFRLLLEGDPDDKMFKEPKTAMELWHLYSYQLHAATFEGLKKLRGSDGQPGRDGRRNFIIGRGSYAGMKRYAGLWTGDNASTWDFLRISIAQVLGAGLTGIAIAGVDCGGFEPEKPGSRWADPELLMRFYGAFFMLPWFRNHYNGKNRESDDKKLRMTKKYFQEPFIYKDQLDPANNPDAAALKGQEWLYLSVLPVTKYFVRLRYTLLQLLYDAMFENVFNGLPIARAMCITDPEDESLFVDNEEYLDNQYMVRNDLLVAPFIDPQTNEEGNINPDDKKRFYGHREVYFPQPDSWYPFNLDAEFNRGNNYYGTRLLPAITGGSVIDYDGAINNDTTQEGHEHIRYLTPMFVREGGIIPQLDVKLYVPDRDIDPSKDEVNHFTIHIYPGKTSDYRMYIDDGVSRDSAPRKTLANQPPCRPATEHAVSSNLKLGGDETLHTLEPDELAGDQYCELYFRQEWSNYREEGQKLSGTRKITIARGDGLWDVGEIWKRYGETMDIVLWHADDVEMDKVATSVNAEGQVDGQQRIKSAGGKDVKATVVTVPVKVVDQHPIVIDCEFAYTK